MANSSSADISIHPRRAILYIAWGKEHLQLAMNSAHSTAFMNIPAILYTDAATTALIPDDAPFHRVIAVDMTEYNHLAKFYIVDNLPDDFDSFLYLDVDTTVLKDITFAFEMAERHGIAMAPASHYSLDHFHGFGEVMQHANVPLRGQYVYNAGVIFFTRRADVMEVLNSWKRLAFRLIEETGFKKTDQPFLTLAMEMLRFNPYTLAPTYNYRALIGEPISGDVLLWHSYHPVPAGINEYDRPWPRAYRGGRKVSPTSKWRRLLKWAIMPKKKKMRMQKSEGHLGGYILDRPAPGTWCPRTWDWLIKDHGVRSMLDIGCGLGYVMKYFHEHGCEVMGVDGSPSAFENNVMQDHVFKHDFSKASWAPEKDVDLVWSSEFLEHVEEKYIQNYMSAFNKSTNLVVVTYAIPGQGGHHHVNENTEAYWIDQFRKIDFFIDREMTMTARSLLPAEGVEGKQFRNKGLVFRRRAVSETRPA